MPNLRAHENGRASGPATRVRSSPPTTAPSLRLGCLGEGHGQRYFSKVTLECDMPVEGEKTPCSFPEVTSSCKESACEGAALHAFIRLRALPPASVAFNK